jgi:hypothetical protein
VLRITVELVPGGYEGMKRELARAHVSNLSALAARSDYAVAIYANEIDNPVAGCRRWESRGMIADHDREQSVWALVAKVSAWAAAEAQKRS